jgi:NADP-dependent 3-hydroxy acid dehydrogenase YdfG
MITLSNKIVLITGGARGLGAAISHTLAKDGAVAIPVDVNAENLHEVVDTIKASGGKAEGFEMNVADKRSVENVVKKIISSYEKIDAVINNAGIDYTKSIEEFEYEEWKQVIDVNLYGPFVVSKAVYPYMKQHGGGHIVNIASTASRRAWPNASAYHASKWGLLGFSQALHAESRKDNIKVTAVIAGGMQTPFLLERFPDIDIKLLQDPKNVAEAVKYVLCQPEGTVIPEMMVLPMHETSWP